MPLTVDASTPAYVTNLFFSVVTASFTPPDNSILVAGANTSTPNSLATLSISNNGTALTWNQIAFINSAVGKKGASGLWYALLPTGRALTVTASEGGAGNGVSLKVLVLQGADLTSVVDGTATSGSNNLNTFSTTAITTTRAGSILLVASEDSNDGSMSSSDLTKFSSQDAGGNGTTGLVGYKILGAAGSASANVTSTGTTAINFVAGAIKAALVGAPPSTQRRRRNQVLVR